MRVNARPTPTESMTLEQQSAGAFISTCMIYLPWIELREDICDLWKKGKVPAKLVKHLKYLLAAVCCHTCETEAR